MNRMYTLFACGWVSFNKKWRFGNIKFCRGVSLLRSRGFVPEVSGPTLGGSLCGRLPLSQDLRLTRTPSQCDVGGLLKSF